MSIFIVLSVALALYFAQNLIYKWFWNHKLDLSVSFEDRAAFEGERSHLIEVLSNDKIFPLPWVSAKFQVSRNLIFPDKANYKISDDYYRSDVFSIIMFQRITRKIPFVCGKRGYYTIKSADLLSSNVLISLKLVMHVECGTSLTVYPRLIDLDGLDIPFKRLDGSVIAKRFTMPDPFEFRGIRAYEPTDSLKSINFKATAKTGVLMSNVYDHTVSQEAVIILNLQPYSSWVDEELFENAIRLAASIAARFAGDGVPVGVISNGRDIITGEETQIESGSGDGHLNVVYESLARIDLHKVARPISGELSDMAVYARNERLHVLISTYCEKDLRDAFFNLEQSSLDCLWIIPSTSRIRWEDESFFCGNIVKWETDRGGMAV